MTTKKRGTIPTWILFIVTLLGLVGAGGFLTSCTDKHYHVGENGDDGVDGEDGEDGQDGNDGSDGLAFDYVRGMDGAMIYEGALIIQAEHVVPPAILAFAPEEDPYDQDGLTLTFGTIESPIRVYLGRVWVGQYCVIERDEGVLGQLDFYEDGYVAIVPPEYLSLFNLTPTDGVVVEFEGECKELNYSSRRIKLGKDIVIRID